MRRQPSEPLNPSLPECTDLSSFKHKYTDEEYPGGEQHGTGVVSSHSDKVRALPKTQRLV